MAVSKKIGFHAMLGSFREKGFPKQQNKMLGLFRDEGVPKQRGYAIRLIQASVCALVIAAAVLPAGAQTSARQRVSVEPSQPVMLMVDGKIIEAQSLEYKRGEQVMIWLRELENMGWGKTAPGEDGAVLFQGNGVTLSFVKGENVAKLNSLAVQLPVAAYLRNGKLMVPLSFVAKSLGFEYDLGYRPVASVFTKPTKPADAVLNTLTGKVTYAGKGIANINIRIVDREFRTIKGATAKTGADGSFSIGNLKDGEYMAYVYVKDNPDYFNCASDPIKLKGGAMATVRTLAIGHVITPLTPKADSKVNPSGGKIKVEWQTCPLATTYELSVHGQNTTDRIPDILTKTPNAKLLSANLRPGATYELEVRALDASRRYIGWTVGTGGKVWRFTVAQRR